MLLVLLLAIPSSLRLAALGGVGYPAAMLALPLGLWWCWAALRGLHRGAPPNPVKIALFCFLAALLASYAWAMRRALPAVEMRQADIGLLRAAVLASVVLVCCDGISSTDRFVVLVRRLALASGLLAALGLAQFVTGRDLVGWISLPGFTQTQDFDLVVRSGFARASGTATHPLEYAAGLSVLFPFALTLALHDVGRKRWRRWWPAALTALVLVLSGSRSGYLGLLVGIVFLATTWSRRLVALVGLAGVALMVVVFVAVPGMLGTIRGLFLSTGTDTSTTSRSTSYALVEDFVVRSPVLGRGFGTFLPSYRILDNQVLQLLVETGIVGLLAFAALGAAAVSCAVAGRRRTPPGLLRQLGGAAYAAVGASFVLTFFFDALGFPISACTLALAVGLCGGYWRLTRTRLAETAAVPSVSPADEVARPVLRPDDRLVRRPT